MVSSIKCCKSISLCVSGPVLAVLSRLSGSWGPEGGARRSAEPIRSRRLPLPANHREASEDLGGDHRRPVVPEHGEDQFLYQFIQLLYIHQCASLIHNFKKVNHLIFNDVNINSFIYYWKSFSSCILNCMLNMNFSFSRNFPRNYNEITDL